MRSHRPSPHRHHRFGVLAAAALLVTCTQDVDIEPAPSGSCNSDLVGQLQGQYVGLRSSNVIENGTVIVLDTSYAATVAVSQDATGSCMIWLPALSGSAFVLDSALSFRLDGPGHLFGDNTSVQFLFTDSGTVLLYSSRLVSGVQESTTAFTGTLQ